MFENQVMTDDTCHNRATRYAFVIGFTNHFDYLALGNTEPPPSLYRHFLHKNYRLLEQFGELHRCTYTQGTQHSPSPHPTLSTQETAFARERSRGVLKECLR
jgi:hypothetical protein